MLKGRFTHEDISKAAPIGREASIGVVAHYAIGLALGAGYGLILRVPRQRQSTLPRATAYGVATTVLPWFWMFPARGQGVMGLRDGDLRVPAFALCTHVAYGLGLRAASLDSRALRDPPDTRKGRRAVATARAELTPPPA